MKISIIGGSGIVGNGIFSFLKDFHEVSIFDSSSFDRKSAGYHSNDLFDCDVFIHAAGITDELVKDDIDFAVYKANSFVNYLVENLIRTNCKNIIYLSTIHVHGDLSQRISKRARPDPLNLYSLLHYNTEKVFEILLRPTSINFLGLRVPTVYGFPRDLSRLNRPNIIQFSFPLSLVKHNQIELHTSGSQYRLFVSNCKVGKVINKWIVDFHKDQFTVDKGFASLCISQYAQINGTIPKLLTNQSNIENETAREIHVDSLYKSEEHYPIQRFLVDFFQENIWTKKDGV